MTIQWVNIRDDTIVQGIAYVKKGFQAQLHQHPEAEDYYFVYGTGILYHNRKREIIHAPKKIHIEADDIHAMTPLSDYVVLFYQFAKGPFSSVKYTYLKSYL